MLSQNLVIILSLCGACLSLLLTVNAFFIRQLVLSIGQVDKGLGVLIERHNGTSERMKVNEKNIEKVDNEVISLRKRLHQNNNDLNKRLLEIEIGLRAHE